MPRKSESHNCIISRFRRPDAIDAALRRPGPIRPRHCCHHQYPRHCYHHQYPRHCHLQLITYKCSQHLISTIAATISAEGRLDREFSIAPPSPTARAAITSALTSALQLTPPDRVALVCPRPSVSTDALDSALFCRRRWHATDVSASSELTYLCVARRIRAHAHRS